MERSAFILLIRLSPGDEYLSELLAGDTRFRFQVVHQVPMALARISGGGVDLVVMDLSSSQEPEIVKLDSFLDLRTKSPEVPIVVVRDDGSDPDALVNHTATVGGAKFLTRSQCAADLKPLILGLIPKHVPSVEFHPHLGAESRKSGAVITLLGAKGGVGTTTMALNLGSALAQWGRVILTEVPPMCGSLSRYFRPSRLTGDLVQLLRRDEDGSDHAQLDHLLWHYENTPGLNVLFGRQSMDEWIEPSPQAVRSVVKNLALLADYVVVDLPPSCSEVNRTVIESSDRLLLVVGREPLCIESAQSILRAIRGWNVAPALLGSIIVNRAAYAAPVELSEIEMHLAIPILGVMPPAPDLCVAAEKAGMPLTLCEPDTSLSLGIINLAAALASPSRRNLRAS